MYEVISPNHHLTFSRLDVVLFGLLVVWSAIWKAIALWRAARNNQLGWFVVMAILNTAGILEIVYILCFGRMTARSTNQTDAA